MGGGLPSPKQVIGGGITGSPGGAEADYLKRVSQVTEIAMAGLDPGGLVYTAEDKDIAAWQAMGDIGGYGSKSTVATREAAKKAEMENIKAAQAAGQERRLIEAQQGIEAEKKRRLDERRRRQIERGSLMYGVEAGMGDTLG